MFFRPTSQTLYLFPCSPIDGASSIIPTTTYFMAGIRTRISQTVAPPLKGRSTDSASATTAFKNDFNHQDPTIFESLSQFQFPSLAERDSNLGLDESLAAKNQRSGKVESDILMTKPKKFRTGFFSRSKNFWSEPDGTEFREREKNRSNKNQSFFSFSGRNKLRQGSEDPGAGLIKLYKSVITPLQVS